jgi:hypothetical protein
MPGLPELIGDHAGVADDIDHSLTKRKTPRGRTTYDDNP